MDWFKDFVINNWQFIVSSILLLISVLIGIFKKTIKINDGDFQECLLKIPGFINEAESQFGPGNGQKKFQYVMNSCMNMLEVSYGQWVRVNFPVRNILTAMIESVLSTPQKHD